MLAVINCKQLVTLAGPSRGRTGEEMLRLSIITDGAMLVRDDRIEKVGTRAQIEPQISNAYNVVDAGGRVVLPGFVDAHTHPVFAGNRAAEFEERARGASYQEIAARGGGIQSTVRATRVATLEELVEAGKRYAQLVSPQRHDDSRSKVGIWPHGRRRTQDTARDSTSLTDADAVTLRRRRFSARMTFLPEYRVAT